ncbi:hypothetical protein E2I00_010714, partial [Balaenoptera physalus]
FNSMKPITTGLGNYTGCPMLKDRIHCVAFVFDANSVGHLSDEMVEKIRRIRRELIKCGESLSTLLLRAIDYTVGCFGDKMKNLRNCICEYSLLEAVHRELGFALSDIFVVSNYTSEWELEPVMDVLNLSALRQMLWAADDFLEDLPLEET